MNARHAQVLLVTLIWYAYVGTGSYVAQDTFLERALNNMNGPPEPLETFSVPSIGR